MTTADTTSIAPKAQTHNPADNSTLASNAADTTNVKADKKADALKTPAHRAASDSPRQQATLAERSVALLALLAAPEADPKGVVGFYLDAGARLHQLLLPRY